MEIEWKQSNQLQYVPRPMPPATNGPFSPSNPPYVIVGNWYPPSRPLKQYRNNGSNTNLNIPYTTPPNCNPCANSRQVGVPFKMIGKNNVGINQLDTCCVPGPLGSKQGNIIDFSGKASIRTATNPQTAYSQYGTRRPYYTNSYMYLYSRGNTFINKSTLGPRITKTEYNESTETTPEFPACKLTTFKPSNNKFKVQGAVSSSARSNRLIYDTIKENNQSFSKKYDVQFQYNQDPIYFLKNKFNACPKCIPRPINVYSEDIIKGG